MALLRRKEGLIADAHVKARWMCKDILTRRSRTSAAELLLAHADEAAGSPDGRDQLLSFLLTAGAADIVGGRPPLDTPPSLTLPPTGNVARIDWRAIAERNPEAAEAAARLVASIVAETAQTETHLIAARRRLRSIARLQLALWTAPEIQADGMTRIVMMLSAPLLFDKAKKYSALLGDRTR